MKVYKAKGYLSSRVSRYPNSTSPFQMSCSIISGDISENPGPSTNKLICPECSRTIAKNRRSLTCSVCDLTYDIKCENAALKDFKLIQRIVPMIWKCPTCLHDVSFDLNLLLCPTNLSTLWWEQIHFTTNLHNAILTVIICTNFPRNKYLTKRLKRWIWSRADWLVCFEHQFILQEKVENWSLKCKQHLRQGGRVYRLTQHMPIKHIFVTESKIDGSVNSSLFAHSES